MAVASKPPKNAPPTDEALRAAGQSFDPPLSPDVQLPSAQSPAPAPLAEGYLRLSDARSSRPKSDDLAPLRPYVNKLIALTSMQMAPKEIKTKDGTKTVLAGTMTFREYGKDDAPEVQCVIPQAAVKALAEAVQAHPDQTIVANVVQMKRGIALQ